MIDTHAHLDGEEFAEDLEEVLQRARQAGVAQILVPNVNGQSFPRLWEVCAAHPDCLFPMIGLHPEDVNPAQIDIDDTLDQMEAFLQSPQADRLVAIGEIGLDFYWDDTYKSQQISAFERQIEWGARYGLPLMIHARNAHDELVQLIQKHASEGLSGVFHCFSGTAEQARQLLQFDHFMLGIGGVLTFKKSTLPSVLVEAEVPLSRIVLETDAPYMAPVPHRGKRNESAFVADVASRLAEVYNLPLEEIDRQTTLNAQAIFQKLAKKTQK